MTRSDDIQGLVERLRKPTDGDRIYEHIVMLRKQTRSDLPRMALCNEFELLDEERREAAALLDAPSLKEEAVGGFQARVQPWLIECFGPEIAADKVERNDRFVEESLELVQSLGYTAERAHALVDYVFGRPTGEPSQEVGGVMVTLAALCLASDLDMANAGETELARINVPEIVAKIRAKQAAKPTGSALPIARTPAVAGIPAGMVAWEGGDSAPEDWDGGAVLYRSGSLYECISYSWRHGKTETGISDIIAYTPKARSTASYGEARERIAQIVDPDAWHNKLPTDGLGVYWMDRRAKALAKADAILAALPTTDGAEPLTMTDAVKAALEKWRALPDDERNGERPYIWGFNAGVDHAVEQGATTDASERMREACAEVADQQQGRNCRCSNPKIIAARIRTLDPAALALPNNEVSDEG